MPTNMLTVCPTANIGGTAVTTGVMLWSAMAKVGTAGTSANIRASDNRRMVFASSMFFSFLKTGRDSYLHTSAFG